MDASAGERALQRRPGRDRRGDIPMDTTLPAYKAVGERRYRETSGLYWEDF